MSVLGTGNYESLTYKGRRCSTETRFVQEATLKDIGVVEWNEHDAVYILLTDEAWKRNWDRNISERRKNGGEVVAYSGLELSLEQMNLRCAVKDVAINDGKSESEMWDIFNAVYALLEDGDELYFDLTHGFRYLPMLLLVLGNYAKFLKNIKIKYLSYGNYEARVCGVAPIVDLLPLAVLQDWTTAASSFSETGRVEVLCSLLNEIIPVTTDKRLTGHLKVLQSNLKAFQQQIETCCGKEICEGKAVGEIKKYTKLVIKEGRLPEPTYPIFNSVNKEIGPFSENTTDNIRSAIKWCEKYGLIQQGYTMCQEGIVTILCEKFSDLNPFVEDAPNKNYRNYRDYWSSILGIPEGDRRDEDKWKPILKNHRDLTRSIFTLEWVLELRKRYNKLTGGRNHVNHGGFTGGLTSQKIKEDFDRIVKSFLEFCDWKLEKPKIVETSSNEASIGALFINFSNHPFSSWSEAQLTAARQYGELAEVPFPDIDPDWTENELCRVVDESLKKIRTLSNGKKTIVHIMGEMTFTYAIVYSLKNEGIRCVASTSERNSIENTDGSKTSHFAFVRFRNYE